MPMGDCDRMKKYISDYVDKSLDPTTRKEFENKLELYPELRSTTKNISALSKILNKLPMHKCSDDFMINLRQRISVAPQHSQEKSNMVKYAFAFSFLVLAVITIFQVNSIINKQDNSNQFQQSFENQQITPEPTNIPVGTTNNPYIQNDAVDIKPRAEQDALKDSLLEQKDAGIKPQTKYVKQTNKVPVNK